MTCSNKQEIVTVRPSIKSKSEAKRLNKKNFAGPKGQLTRPPSSVQTAKQTFSRLVQVLEAAVGAVVIMIVALVAVYR